MGLNKSTLSEQIYQILRNDILTQKIKCGEKLTLKILQERFQVSSTPIREALTRLTQDQLVSYYSNIGVNVIRFTSEDLREIYSFMGDLDGLAIRYASAFPDQEKLMAEAKQILENDRKAAAAGDTKVWNLCSDEFHLIFTATATIPASPNLPIVCVAEFPSFPTSTARKPESSHGLMRNIRLSSTRIRMVKLKKPSR